MREISPPSHHPPPGAGILWVLMGSESEERANVHRRGRGLPRTGPRVSLPGKAACFQTLPFHSFHPWRGQLSHAGVFPGAGEDVRRCQSGPASAGQWDVLGSPVRGPAGHEVGRGIQVVTAEDSRDEKSGP